MKNKKPILLDEFNKRSKPFLKGLNQIRNNMAKEFAKKEGILTKKSKTKRFI